MKQLLKVLFIRFQSRGNLGNINIVNKERVELRFEAFLELSFLRLVFTSDLNFSSYS